VILGRELTISEAYHKTLGYMLGPVGWLLADAMFPPTITVTNTRQPTPPRKPKRTASGRNINISPSGETRFIPNEILLRFAAGMSEPSRSRLIDRLNLTLLESQTFALTGETIGRYRIDGGRSAVQTLNLIARDFPGVAAAQVNFAYVGAQAQQPARQDSPASDASAQYVVRKLHLLEAHRVNRGDDVLVAVIDSKVDKSHPDLAGAIADEFDAVGTPAPAHTHGTAIAGAIAANSKLVGVAPRVRLLAVRAFSGAGESAQSTTFDFLKGLDWAAAKNARIINMSFAGPADPMLQEMLARANARGIVLIAAVSNAGRNSPPLYPGAGAGVIGVTATDAEDKLMLQANRGPQVAVAAPGVEILAAAPDGKYQITRGHRSRPLTSAGLPRCCWRRNRNSLRRKCAAILSAPPIEFLGRATKSERCRGCACCRKLGRQIAPVCAFPEALSKSCRLIAMAAPESLLVEHPTDDIVVFRINRPQVRNALNLEVRVRLAEEITRCGADSKVRCVIVTGSDVAFAAGADIGEMAEAGPVEVMSRNVQKYWRAIMDCPKPVIAAVEGFALGGGLELALCADIIVAGESAKLGLPEVKVGILPGGGGTQKLARLVGRHRAMLLIMTGRMFGAAEALSMGVISEVAPTSQALVRAIEIAREIAAMPPISIMQIKEIVNAGVNAPLDTALMLERKAFQLQFATRDQKEGMRAFMEKRKPKFEGQ
jgi:enoyl-CoA hydratase